MNFNSRDSATLQFWHERILAAGLPRQMFNPISNYMLHGVRPGSFLTALLENDLKSCVLSADDANRHILPQYVDFLITWASADCWGSKTHVQAWINAGGLVGKLRERNATPVASSERSTRYLLRQRWKVVLAAADPRPFTFPPPGPYWVAGIFEAGDKFGYHIITLFPPDVDIAHYWPELHGVEADFTERVASGTIVFSERFPCPEWWDVETWTVSAEYRAKGGL